MNAATFPAYPRRRVRCLSGLTGERSRLRSRYDSAAEFAAYSDTYGLAERLGYASAAEAWEANPLIESSTNPRDFRKVG